MYRPHVYYSNSNSAKATGLEVYAAFVYLAFEEIEKVIWIVDQ